MIIDRIRRLDATSVACDARFEGRRKDAHALFVRTEAPHSLEADPNGFLIGAFIPAWLSRETRIRVDGAICPLLAANLSIAARLLQTWHPKLPPPPVVECDHGYRPPGTKSAAFFSGGVDSLATVHTLTKLKPPGHPDRPSAAIVVDMRHHPGIDDNEADARFARGIAVGRELCGEIGLDVISLHSNLSLLSPSTAVWIKLYHGAYFAGMAHFLGHDFRLFYLASAYPATHLVPWGSHPQLDPLHSSQHVRMMHDGIEFTRLQKIEALSDWPAALERIYVCMSQKSSGGNCGKCEKCIRTRLHLLVAGAPSGGAFPQGDLRADEVRSVRLWSEFARICFEDALPGLRRLGRDDLVAVVERLVRDYERQKAAKRA